VSGAKGRQPPHAERGDLECGGKRYSARRRFAKLWRSEKAAPRLRLVAALQTAQWNGTMKRVGNLFEAVVEPENLRLAFWKASRGKRDRPDQRAFAMRLEDEIEGLRVGLLQGDYPVGEYTRFTVYDPKERVICAAAFRERVLHHALMNVCEPWIDKWLIADTFACRVGMGQARAVRRAQAFARRHAWFLKCDVRKFFDSVPHVGLKALLRRKFKDGRLLSWCDRIIDTYETAPGRGLPIGNLTSQHFANLYLDPLDRFVKETLRFGGYVRYMDDFVVWGADGETLKRARSAVTAFAAERLGLELKAEAFINRTRHGMDFLGMRVFPHTVRIDRRSLRRFVAKTRRYEWLLAQGVWTERRFQERMTALTAFVAQGDTLHWRRDFFRERATNVGLEPVPPGRELEQQRQQRALRQPELEQPEQQQQQQRVPGRLPLSTTDKLEERVWSPSVSGFRQRNEERLAA
jgi:hypothetical protein